MKQFKIEVRLIDGEETFSLGCDLNSYKKLTEKKIIGIFDTFRASFRARLLEMGKIVDPGALD